MIDHQSALIYTMVLASAADSEMTDAELGQIGDIVSHLPIFGGFDPESLPSVAAECAELLGQAAGLDGVLDVIRDSLPERLIETAYALACDVTAADGVIAQEELRLLELLRHGLDVPRLSAAAIERAAAARYIAP
jgi:tellurite resistance protein